MQRSATAFLLAALASGASQACYSPPAHQFMGVDEQIAQAVDVSLVLVQEASAIEPGHVRYDFVVEKRLRGPSRDRFSLVVRADSAEESRSYSEDHTDAAFWQPGGGRLSNYSDCEIHPRFTVGERYLVFYGDPVTKRSFERIRTIKGQASGEDRWLAYVEQRLSGPWSTNGRPRPPWRKQTDLP